MHVPVVVIMNMLCCVYLLYTILGRNKGASFPPIPLPEDLNRHSEGNVAAVLGTIKAKHTDYYG